MEMVRSLNLISLFIEIINQWHYPSIAKVIINPLNNNPTNCLSMFDHFVGMALER